MAYSHDLRERVMAACDRSIPTKQVAEMFGVAASWVRRLKQWRRERGSTAPRPCGGSEPKLGPEAEAAIHAHFRAHPDTTIAELKTAVQTDVSEVTVWRTARRLGYRFKKKSTHAAEQDRPDVVERRREWADQTQAIDPSRLVFLDESGAKTNMTRGYGWGLGGDRVVDTVPHGHWQTTTILAAIRVDGVIPEACLALEGAINGMVFEQYVEDMLAPTLRPGDIVVMDNLASHKGKAVAEAIEAMGAQLWYLPPYSPDLNPIERMWSQVKSLVKKAKARAQGALYEAIGAALQTVGPNELAHYYAAAGYATND